MRRCLTPWPRCRTRRIERRFARAIAHVYAPWLRDAAELFQERVKQQPLPGRDVPRLADVPGGTCVLFADGLRFDVGQKLKAMLESRLQPAKAGTPTDAVQLGTNLSPCRR